jgi:hypothetical protein
MVSYKVIKETIMMKLLLQNWIVPV